MSKIIIKGNIRVAKHTLDWFGFTLQKGHLFGTTVDGLRFVSACRVDKYGDFIVYTQYIGDEDRGAWERDHYTQTSMLGAELLAALRERNGNGIDKVIVPMPSHACFSSMMSRNGVYKKPKMYSGVRI